MSKLKILLCFCSSFFLVAGDEPFYTWLSQNWVAIENFTKVQEQAYYFLQIIAQAKPVWIDQNAPQIWHFLNYNIELFFESDEQENTKHQAIVQEFIQAYPYTFFLLMVHNKDYAGLIDECLQKPKISDENSFSLDILKDRHLELYVRLQKTYRYAEQNKILPSQAHQELINRKKARERKHFSLT